MLKPTEARDQNKTFAILLPSTYSAFIGIPNLASIALIACTLKDVYQTLRSSIYNLSYQYSITNENITNI